MNPLVKLIRADGTRKTRFHTSNGQLCLNAFDFGFSLVTTLLGRTTGKLAPLPWIAMPAVRFLRPHARNAFVFEYSSGMSTVWYARRCREVHCVEDQRRWFDEIRRLTERAANVRIEFAPTPAAYIAAIDRFPDFHFDVISIDGSHRRQCYERSIRHLKAGGLLVVDNTDSPEHEPLAGALARDFPGESIHRFAGYPPGICHPVETTICVKP